MCSGTTGHAEVVRISFDPKQILYRQLLEVFFAIHDPTTLNRQGADVGTQYRSAIFSHSPEQTAEARALLEHLNETLPPYSSAVTEIVDASEFFPAEAYHQRYFATNPGQGYCSFVINPKVASFRRKFSGLLRNPDQ